MDSVYGLCTESEARDYRALQLLRHSKNGALRSRKVTCNSEYYSLRRRRRRRRPKKN